MAPLQILAVAEDDVLQLAVNYVFTGRIDPRTLLKLSIENLIVVVFEPKFQAYVRYYLGRFKLDSARISKTYSGQQIFYVLEIQGDDIIVVEHLNPDKTTVARAFKSAQVPLPGDIDQSEKALRLISDRCKAEKPKLPF